MSARVEVQAPRTVRSGNLPWIAAALALAVVAGALVWMLTRGANPSVVPQPQPGIAATHQDSGGQGLVNTGGATRPMPYEPVAPAIAPHAPAAPVAPAAADAPPTAGGWHFHMISTGGEVHPAPSV